MGRAARDDAPRDPLRQPRDRRPLTLLLRRVADVVALVHLLFVLFVVFGGLPVGRRTRRARAPGKRA